MNSPGTTETPTKSLDRLLRPRSIALVGASTTPGSLGECVLLNLERAAFSGELYLVNPKRPVIRGRQCFGSIEKLPSNIDCAVLAIPSPAVLPTVRTCAERGFGSVIVFSAGFAEGGEQGRLAQEELSHIAQEYGIVIEGPNCLGMVNYIDGVPLTFVVTPPQQRIQGPGAAIISQSGALAAVIAVDIQHQKVPLTFSISTGNEADKRVEDFFEHLIGDAATRVIVLIVEQFREPKRFLELAHRAREHSQFVILLHPGSSKAARESAATHTGAIAGDYQVMHTMVSNAGVIHVDTMEELVDVTQLLVRAKQLPRSGAAIFTESGAFKAFSLDLCERIGLQLPELSPECESGLREALPPFIPPSNPLDTTAQALVDPGLYRRALPHFLNDDAFGSVLLAIILTDVTTRDLKLPSIIDAIKSLPTDKPIVFAALDEGAPFESEGIDTLRSLGVTCFPSPERAMRALARVSEFGRRQARLVSSHSECSANVPSPRGVLSEYESKQILREIGIRVPEGTLAATKEDALKIAKEIGFPIAMKAQAKQLAHKTEAGGVVLGIRSEGELLTGWDAIQRNVQSYGRGLKLDGLLVERMSPNGIELIIGARHDRDWGPVLLIGFGGVMAEVLKDTRLIPCGLSPSAIKEELFKLRSSALLRGFRGAPPADVDGVIDVVTRIGNFMQSYTETEEIDINPLLVLPSGDGVIALDALIVFE